MDGQPHYESSKSPKKADAIRLLNAKRAAVDAGELIGTKATVGQLVGLVVADYRLNRKANVNKIEGYQKNYIGPLLGAESADGLTTERISKFIGELRRRKLAEATINRQLAALRRGYSLARDSRPPLVNSVPKFPHLREAIPRQGFLEHSEYLKLRDALPDHQRTILTIGYHLGLRKGEILNLRWDQVDWDANLLRLHGGQTKNRAPRMAPLYGDLLPWLCAEFERHKQESPDCLFIVSFRDRSIKETKTGWKRACAEVGLPNLLIHDLRRSALRLMIRAGVPTKVAMLLSGHKTMSVFHRYDIIDEADVQNAGAKMAAYLKEVTKEVTVAKNKKRLSRLK